MSGEMKYIRLAKYTLIFIMSFLFSCSDNQIFEEDFETYYEKSNFLETPSYEETIEYCKLLDKFSDKIKLIDIGISPEGRKIPLLIANNESEFNPESPKNNGDAVLLIQACIHSGECEGKDAGLMLLRDIFILNKYQEINKGVTILFLPIFSVDAHERFGPYNRINQNGPKEMGWRTTSQNLNLNRDYAKADAIEIRAWLHMFHSWKPDFFIDCHTTDGADYQYPLTYGIEINGNMSEEITNWQKNKFLNPLLKKLEDDNIPMYKYVYFRQWHDPESGLVGWVAPPFLSEGYTAINNRPGLLLETHMLKNYKIRVDATYLALKHSIDLLSKNRESLKKTIADDDEYTSSKKFRNKEFVLSWNTSFKDSTTDKFMGYEYTKTKSDLTGGIWYQYDNNIPVTFDMKVFEKQIPAETCLIPEAYILGPQWTEIIERLGFHNIKITKTRKPIEIEVRSYKFSDVEFPNFPYEGHFKPTYRMEEITELRSYPKGSVIVRTNNKMAKVIAHLLEPKGPDSFLNWGFFNIIFEQKEYAESYVMEKIARDMIKDNPELKSELDKKLDAGEIRRNQRDILNWFYKKTPYWDNKKDKYPVGKIYDLEKLNI